MHGGARNSGAPAGNRNALKGGFYTVQAKAERRLLRALLKHCTQTLDDIAGQSVVAELP